MREVTVIDRDRQLIHLGNNIREFKGYLEVGQRTRYLERYANLVNQKWDLVDSEVKCSVIMLCLDEEPKKGPPFYDSHVMGYYTFDFNVTSTGDMNREADSGDIVVFEPFRNRKYGSFLVDKMIDFLKSNGLWTIEIIPWNEKIERHLEHRRHKLTGVYWL